MISHAYTDSHTLTHGAPLPLPARSLEVDGKPATLARAGDSAELTLTGIEASAASPGSVVCHPDFPTQLAVRFEARLAVLDVAVPLLRGQQVRVHVPGWRYWT